MTKDMITCPIENTLKLINRKWVIVLIRDMFTGKKHFKEFNENKPNLSNTVLAETLKFMENNNLIEKKKSLVNNKPSTEYYLRKKGSRLNRILYEMAIFGIDELECGDEGDLEIINMFKEYYAELLKV
ncbi:winged helix-turn-helix transcriptional regulator [Methanobrevibacter olleyae]|uniref:winged helix-turn-helix transcriptional regulator n=1 Tax=Methanobrevibacter olleyae TaxID=294671 RepID=UPI001F3E4409|nr:helix-turn-helix domain-containing protein [Methanobrevibacter olleyae]